jgi:hypothetical protein
VTAFLVFRLALLIVALLAVRRVWRASTVQGLLTLLLPFYVFVAMVRYWSDPDHGIRWHVLVLTVGGVLGFFWQQRLIHEYVTQQAALQAQLLERQSGDESDADDETDGDAAPDTTMPHATIEFGPAARLANRPARTAPAQTPVEHAADASPVRHVDAEPAPRASAAAPDVAAAARPTLRDALASATFLRGRFDRSSSGFALELPAHFHALVGVDARRIESSLGLAPDTREVAWVMHENVQPGSPDSWHVRVRWLDDGWIALSGSATDTERLLRDAQQASSTSARLAGSGGALVGYAVAPSFDAQTVDWVEERLPDNTAESVLDCHALRIGQRGVVEFSVVGARPGTQVLCDLSVRLLARNVRFDAGYAHTADPPAAVRHAGYTATDLVAQRP